MNRDSPLNGGKLKFSSSSKEPVLAEPELAAAMPFQLPSSVYPACYPMNQRERLFRLSSRPADAWEMLSLRGASQLSAIDSTMPGTSVLQNDESFRRFDALQDVSHTRSFFSVPASGHHGSHMVNRDHHPYQGVGSSTATGDSQHAGAMTSISQEPFTPRDGPQAEVMFLPPARDRNALPAHTKCNPRQNHLSNLSGAHLSLPSQRDSFPSSSACTTFPSTSCHTGATSHSLAPSPFFSQWALRLVSSPAEEQEQDQQIGKCTVDGAFEGAAVMGVLASSCGPPPSLSLVKEASKTGGVGAGGGVRRGGSASGGGGVRGGRSSSGDAEGAEQTIGIPEIGGCQHRDEESKRPVNGALLEGWWQREAVEEGRNAEEEQEEAARVDEEGEGPLRLLVEQSPSRMIYSPRGNVHTPHTEAFPSTRTGEMYDSPSWQTENGVQVSGRPSRAAAAAAAAAGESAAAAGGGDIAVALRGTTGGKPVGRHRQGGYPCKVCQVRFASPQALGGHMTAHGKRQLSNFAPLKQKGGGTSPSLVSRGGGSAGGGLSPPTPREGRGTGGGSGSGGACPSAQLSGGEAEGVGGRRKKRSRLKGPEGESERGHVGGGHLPRVVQQELREGVWEGRREPAAQAGHHSGGHGREVEGGEGGRGGGDSRSTSKMCSPWPGPDGVIEGETVATKTMGTAAASGATVAEEGSLLSHIGYLHYLHLHQQQQQQQLEHGTGSVEPYQTGSQPVASYSPKTAESASWAEALARFSERTARESLLQEQQHPKGQVSLFSALQLEQQPPRHGTGTPQSGMEIVDLELKLWK